MKRNAKVAFAVRALDRHQAAYGRKIPGRLRAFWTSGEALECNGKSFTDAGAPEKARWRLRTAVPAWEVLGQVGGIDIGISGPTGTWEHAGDFVPLFHIGSHFFFVARITDEKCAVGYYEDETHSEESCGFEHGVRIVSSSLDVFVRSLEEPDETALPCDSDVEDIWNDANAALAAAEEESGKESGEPLAARLFACAAKVPRPGEGETKEKGRVKVKMKAKKKARLPDGDWVVWSSEWKGWRLAATTDLPGITRNAARVAPSWKTSTRLVIESDWKEPPPFVDDFPAQLGLKVCSGGLAAFLEERALAGVELLPVVIVDRKKKIWSTDYRLVNPYAQQDALDAAKSAATFNTIRPKAVDSVKKLVLDPKRIEQGVRMFRLSNFREPILVERGLAEEIAAEGFGGVKFESLNKPWS